MASVLVRLRIVTRQRGQLPIPLATLDIWIKPTEPTKISTTVLFKSGGPSRIPKPAGAMQPVAPRI